MRYIYDNPIIAGSESSAVDKIPSDWKANDILEEKALSKDEFGRHNVIAIWAKENISAGEELFIDYGSNYLLT